ncbi:MAG: Tfp pilus assembly protein FimT/FimU [Bradymonadaceae bacterium]
MMGLQSIRKHLRRHPSAGFTLVELMIVVVLIGILAAFSAPSMARTIDRNNAKKVARDLGNTLNMARNHAMSRGEVVLITITPESGTNRGSITLSRTTNRAMSCTTASWAGGGFGGEGATNWGVAETVTPPEPGPFYTFDFNDQGANMAVVALSHADATVGTDSNPICISPNGRVMAHTGATLDGSGACPLRIFVGRPGAGNDLRACDFETMSDADRQKLRDNRDINRFHVVQFPYNGTVQVIQ